jgi:glyoxylase-like metal-dependent hydrolase (beta-lactamase superfamily II)
MPEIAPRIRRIGQELVNAYLVEDGGEVVIVDAGVPGYWGDLLGELTAMGRTPSDVREVLLTHGHGDHIGFAERARRAGMRIRVHEDDAALARGEVPNRGDYHGPKRIGPIVRFLWFVALRGYLRVPKIREVSTFGDGATLDVPGAPRVVHAPGHTRGSAALHFPAHDALFVGDALNTYSFASGERGPMLSPLNLDRGLALASLGRLEATGATNVLPGHGVAWREGIGAAVEAARKREALPT